MRRAATWAVDRVVPEGRGATHDQVRTVRVLAVARLATLAFLAVSTLGYVLFNWDHSYTPVAWVVTVAVLASLAYQAVLRRRLLHHA